MIFSQSKQLLKISCTNFWLKVDILTRNIVFTLYNVCSVHRGIPWIHRGDIMSTSGDVQYIRGISWWMWGDTMSTSGDVQYMGGIPWVYRGGYHEYIGRCSVHRRDIMIHVGEQLDKILSISIENSDVLNIPRYTHDIPPMYSWYPPDVLMVSTPMYWTSPDVLMVSPTCIMISPDVLNIPRCTHDIPRCTHGIPPMYWTPPMYSWYPSDVLNTPRCTHDILPMYSWYPPMYSWYPPMYSWYPPDVLMVSPRCTEHPPMYWTSPDVLNTHYTGWFSELHIMRDYNHGRSSDKIWAQDGRLFL